MPNNIEKLVASYATEVQELNDAALGFLIDLFLDDAVGVQLDGLGTIIGVERAGFSDDQYRALLRAQIRVNASSGTIEDVITSVARAADVTTGVVLEEGKPAEFKVTCDTALNLAIAIVAAEVLYQAKPAGVHGVFEFFNLVPVFTFDGVSGSKFDGGYYLKTAIRNRGGRESEVL